MHEFIRKMSLRSRALVFSTFFVSCLAIGLLLVSLTTTSWVKAFPKRRNSLDSKGEINYGLFQGTKDLNSGFGVRSYPVDVYAFIQSEPNVMNFWLWFITAFGTGFGLLACVISAISAVLKAAASSSKKLGSVLILIASNASAAISQILALTCWLIQFKNHLQYNVLSVEDHRHSWFSHGLASLGYSFYLVIISTLVVFINISILIYVRRCERHLKRQRFECQGEEKNQSAIMLY